MLKVFFLSILFIITSMQLGEAQQSIHHSRIGLLVSGFPPPHSSPLDDNFKAFHEGLRELGYIEGKNILSSIDIARGSLDGCWSLRTSSSVSK
jgi:hypothetical protein